MLYYINSKQETCTKEISKCLQSCIAKHPSNWNELVFLCIGSDRITGDCLGPYVGQQLLSERNKNFSVYGTLLHPVHAQNLEAFHDYIHQHHNSPLIIAIDASLGQKKHLGFVTIKNGSLHPGAGVQKRLFPVGDICITGIVNVSGILEQMTLQTTRLSTVIYLANKITQGILNTFTVQINDCEEL